MKYLWEKLRLHTQIIIVSTVILAITIFVITGVNINREKTNSTQHLLENALALAHSLSATITYNVIEERYDAIEELLISLADFPDVKSLKVVDVSGGIVSYIKKSNKNEAYVSYAEETDAFPLTLKNNLEPIHFFDQDSLIIWYPFKTSNVLGWVNINMTLSEVNFQQGIVVRNNIIGALIAILIDVLILMLAISIPSRKINRAIEVAQQLDADNPHLSNETGGSFEINKLLSLLNGVANRLATSREINDANLDLTETNLDLTEYNHKLEQLSRTDALTNISNRRYFDETLEAETRRQSRQGTPLTLMICDIDFFKQYNDSYGHQAGDACLQQVASSINSSFSRVGGDLVARYGGEEFAVILPNVDKTNALILAEKMRENIEKLALEHNASSIASVVTLSIGVTTLEPNMNASISVIIKNADDALYSAKAAGRNNVQYSSSDNGDASFLKNII